MAATMKDISRMTGLSIATVSKCINGQNVRRENRKLIEDAIEQLGYVRDESARSMKTGRSGIIAIIVPNLEISMICVFVRECQSLLMKKGFVPVVCASENSEEREQELVSRLKASQIDGMIIMPVSRNTTRAYDYLKEQNLPFVFFDQFIPTYPSNCVALRGEKALEELMLEFKEQGHRHIGVMSGALRLAAFERRGARIAEVAERYGIKCLELCCGDGAESVNKLMKHENPPTAVICLSEDVTVSAYVELHRMGYSVPADISLVGVRNCPERKGVLPVDLTLFDQPIGRCAEACVDTLHEKLMLKYDKLSVGGASKRVDVAVKLHRGSTVGSAAK